MTRRIFCIIMVGLCLLAGSSPLSAKPSGSKGYHIVMTSVGGQDSMLMMGYYMLGNSYVLDTAFLDKKGRFVFENKKRELKPGLYFFANDKGEFVDWVVYNEKIDFEFTAQAGAWSSTMTVKGSKENELMCDFHRRSAEITKAIAEGREGPDSAEYAQYPLQRRQEIDQMKLDIIKDHPESMLAKLTNATRPVIPPVVGENGDTLTPQQRYEYYATHYWDYIPLDENWIVRTPRDIFKTPTRTYIEKTLNGLPPKLLTPYLDSLIDRSRGAEDVFRYLVHDITEYYLQSKVMVYDEVYVHLVRRYWESGLVTWMSPSVVEEQIVRANKWENILVGKTAPELIMKDTLGWAHSLHQTGGDFKLLLFWSPTCGHCKTMVPALYEAWTRMIKEFRISVYAVMTEPDEHTVELWKNFIKKYDLEGWFHLNGGEANVDWREVYDVESTPQTFLLDSKNTIIAKHFDAELFEKLLRYED